MRVPHRAGRASRARFAVLGTACVLSAACLTTSRPSGARADRAEPRVVGVEEARIELGRRLFFDPIVSRTGRRACVSCHDPEHGFSDPQRFSDDDFGPSRRHSQTLVDTAENPNGHWDGEFATLEELVLARVDRVPDSNPYDPTPFASPVTRPPPAPTFRNPGGRAAAGPVASLQSRPGRAFGDHPQDLNRLPDVARTVEEAGRYDEAMDAAFGTRSVSAIRIARAISAFCRSIRSTEAPLDRYLSGDTQALSASAQRGLALFRGRAGCAQCHTLSGKHPLLTEFEFRNNGVTWRTLRSMMAGPGAPFDVENVVNADVGRATFSTAAAHARQFKVPTLRDVARRGPYMHDGSFANLADVVSHYAAGGSADPLQDERIRGFDVDEADVADLVALLESFSGDERPGTARRAWARRVPLTRARFVDGRGRPLAGLRVTLVPEGDFIPGASDAGARAQRITDEDGRIEFPPSARTHVRLALPGDVIPIGGALVPDSCARLEVRVPVDGHIRLAIVFASTDVVPSRLLVHHENPLRLPGDPLPSTAFERVHSIDVGGRQAVLYEGWRRTDLSTKVTLRLPRDDARARREVDLAPGGTIHVTDD